jgi:hypothetical protein
MKKIIIIALVLLSITKSNAQIFNPTEGSYITNNTFTPFLGTWRWTSGIDTVKIYLQKKKMHFKFGVGFYWDRLAGWHIYKRGNVIIEHSYDDIDEIFSARTTLLLGNEDLPTNNCGGTFRDLTKKKMGEVSLTLNAAGNQLTWKLEPTQGMKVRRIGDPPFQIGFTLPTNMILIKQ